MRFSRGAILQQPFQAVISPKRIAQEKTDVQGTPHFAAQGMLVPVRFRVVNNGGSEAESAVRLTESGGGAATHAHFGMMEGYAINLSERGVYFVCRGNIAEGDEVEMYFTVPPALTGRGPKGVRCKARIVHVGPAEGNCDVTGAGVLVDHSRLSPATATGTIRPCS